MRIVELEAFPTSFPVTQSVELGIGRAVKRDAVVIRVKTESGLIGYGESHHGRCPGAIAHLVNTTLRDLVIGREASDVVGVWAEIYKKQLGSHGMGAACAMAMSGIDMALWDIRGKATGWPLYKMLGGSKRSVRAYAGGVAIGWQDPESLLDEVRPHLEAGYKAIKVRIGDTPEKDLERVRAVRNEFPDLMIMTDANTGYTLDDARAVIPALDDLEVVWLEEPFPPHDYYSYAQAKTFGRVPLAAGENHYTRFEFNRVIEDRAVTIFQPDLSKTGGITETLRIASMASCYKISINPHSSMTGINMAATIHLLAAIDNAGYFEGDVSKDNLFRDELVSTPYTLGLDGTVQPLEGPGIGLEVDVSFLKAHPVIEGPCYV